MGNYAEVADVVHMVTIWSAKILKIGEKEMVV